MGYKITIFLLIIFLSTFSLISQTQNDIPENVKISISGSDVHLSWNKVKDALGYKIYASDTPNGTFSDISSIGTFQDTTWFGNIPNNVMKFYKVKSILKNNLNIQISQGSIILSWETASGDISYKIYASDRIDGSYTDVSSSGIFYENSWVTNITTDEIKFYYYTAISQEGESGPSQIVGFQKIDLYTTDSTDLNFIAIPFSKNGIYASELASEIDNCDAISKWNVEKQAWETASDAGYKWLNDFLIEDGYPYMINVTQTSVYYICGKPIQQPQYNIITTPTTDLNAIMLPLDKYNLQNASDLGDNIGNVEIVSKFLPQNQIYQQASKGPFGWVGDFSIYPGQPLFVNVSSDTVWPDSSKK